MMGLCVEASSIEVGEVTRMEIIFFSEGDDLEVGICLLHYIQISRPLDVSYPSLNIVL